MHLNSAASDTSPLASCSPPHGLYRKPNSTTGTDSGMSPSGVSAGLSSSSTKTCFMLFACKSPIRSKPNKPTAPFSMSSSSSSSSSPQPRTFVTTAPFKPRTCNAASVPARESKPCMLLLTRRGMLCAVSKKANSPLPSTAMLRMSSSSNPVPMPKVSKVTPFANLVRTCSRMAAWSVTPLFTKPSEKRQTRRDPTTSAVPPFNSSSAPASSPPQRLVVPPVVTLFTFCTSPSFPATLKSPLTNSVFTKSSYVIRCSLSSGVRCLMSLRMPRFANFSFLPCMEPDLSMTQLTWRGKRRLVASGVLICSKT
mmetsp:Transcript_10531/g.19100  ORF Transcript_10531/g.19100 Transcript_10531/m.19100 type:complete len:310 (+) Transcript_10531:680-1609(+)